MKCGQGRGTAVGYKVQTAVEAQHKRMVACEVTNDPGDRAWLTPMALQAQAELASGLDAGADVGSDHGHEVKTGLEAGLTPSGPRPITSATEQLGRFSKADVIDAKGPDTSQCPAGARLRCRFDPVEHGRHIRSSATPACGGWALPPQCPRSQGGRRITRGGAEHLVGEREHRGRSRPEVMTRRMEWVAHPCGPMKRGWDHGDVLLRGLEQVRTELSLTVLADHLRRVLNLVERPRLLGALGGVVPRRRAVWAASASMVLCSRHRFREAGLGRHRDRPSAEGFDTVWRLIRLALCAGPSRLSTYCWSFFNSPSSLSLTSAGVLGLAAT
jgi:Transposase DDE domain